MLINLMKKKLSIMKMPFLFGDTDQSDEKVFNHHEEPFDLS